MELLNKTYCCKPIRAAFRLLAATALILAIMVPPVAVAAETDAKKTAKSQIVVTADKLISDNQGRQAEFIGNVRVTQGKTVIRSNRLKIYFEGNGVGSDAIDKIVASGNVRIDLDGKAAKSELATYITADRKLILEGGDTQIRSGDNVIRGSRITLYRENDRIQVEGGEKTRVEAVFYPEGEILQ